MPIKVEATKTNLPIPKTSTEYAIHLHAPETMEEIINLRMYRSVPTNNRITEEAIYDTFVPETETTYATHLIGHEFSADVIDELAPPPIIVPKANLESNLETEATLLQQLRYTATVSKNKVWRSSKFSILPELLKSSNRRLLAVKAGQMIKVIKPSIKNFIQWAIQKSKNMNDDDIRANIMNTEKEVLQVDQLMKRIDRIRNGARDKLKTSSLNEQDKSLRPAPPTLPKSAVSIMSMKSPRICRIRIESDSNHMDTRNVVPPQRNNVVVAGGDEEINLLSSTMVKANSGEQSNKPTKKKVRSKFSNLGEDFENASAGMTKVAFEAKREAKLSRHIYETKIKVIKESVDLQNKLMAKKKQSIAKSMAAAEKSAHSVVTAWKQAAYAQAELQRRTNSQYRDSEFLWSGAMSEIRSRMSDDVTENKVARVQTRIDALQRIKCCAWFLNLVGAIRDMLLNLAYFNNDVEAAGDLQVPISCLRLLFVLKLHLEHAHVFTVECLTSSLDEVVSDSKDFLAPIMDTCTSVVADNIGLPCSCYKEYLESRGITAAITER